VAAAGFLGLALLFALALRARMKNGIKTA